MTYTLRIKQVIQQACIQKGDDHEGIEPTKSWLKRHMLKGLQSASLRTSPGVVLVGDLVEVKGLRPLGMIVMSTDKDGCA